MEKPLVHLNGTGRTALCEQYEKAGAACYALAGALADAAPNGRDYYLNAPPGSYERARDEHLARLRLVQSVLDDMVALHEHVMDDEPWNGTVARRT